MVGRVTCLIVQLEMMEFQRSVLHCISQEIGYLKSKDEESRTSYHLISFEEVEPYYKGVGHNEH